MITQLTSRALLKLRGKDTQGFLQGQFSNDINVLEGGAIQINAYCQHQGKIIALIWVMKKGDDYYLSFSNDLKSLLVQRLTMFKLMSEVTIEDLSNQMIQLGIIDEAFDDAYRLNDHQSIALVESIDNIDLSDSQYWEMACIENNVAEVVLETSEKFVPQMLNLDVDDTGVSFTKGCYPGQEVVARLHYLGKAKRRMYQFESSEDIKVGDELIVNGSKSSKVSGLIVRSVKLAAKSICLATVEVEFKDSEIRLGNANGPILSRIIND